MIRNAFNRIITLFKYLLISLLAITASRLLLYFFNPDYFKNIFFSEFLNILWQGLRFDLSALAAYQVPFVLVYFIPFPKKSHKIKRSLLLVLFGLSNFLLITLNSIDSIYFRFTLKRSTADLFSFITTGDDTLKLLPQFLKDFWYILVIIIILFYLCTKAYKNVKKPPAILSNSLKAVLLNFLFLIIMAGLIVLAIRGGFQLKPIRILQAAEAVGLNHAPLVLNSPFTVMKTLNKNTLEQKNFFSSEKLKETYDPTIEFTGNGGAMDPMNVVIIIMESFSKEYMGEPFGLEGQTPFLDSLVREGLFFSRAFANGKKSIEGIPAILAGIPSLMQDPYITSVYSNNNITTLASILRKEGYATAFYHGGTTGTMGFDAFSKLAGFDDYYGMEDFEGEDSYDGNWGIFDEAFFQFFGKKLAATQQPFFATFFSLSSHHPYTIPEKYEDVFSGAEHPLLNTINYSDMALEKFFEQVKSASWYNNTLFVITADHTGQSFNPAFATQLGNFSVPLLFYSPNDSTLIGVEESVAQHIDIQPSILGYLGYSRPIFSFGRNLFDISANDENGYAINYLSNIYQFIEGDHVLHFNGEKTIGVYNYTTDSLLKHPLKPDQVASFTEMENKMKAIIQTYNNTLINNLQSVDPKLAH